jgi:hypothetical protein
MQSPDGPRSGCEMPSTPRALRRNAPPPPPVVVVVIRAGDEQLPAPDEPHRLAAAEPLGDLREGAADRSQPVHRPPVIPTSSFDPRRSFLPRPGRSLPGPCASAPHRPVAHPSSMRRTAQIDVLPQRRSEPWGKGCRRSTERHRCTTTSQRLILWSKKSEAEAAERTSSREVLSRSSKSRRVENTSDHAARAAEQFERMGTHHLLQHFHDLM